MSWLRTKRTMTAAALPLAAAGMALTGTGSAQAATTALPAHYAAPYLYIDSGNAGDLAADLGSTGLKDYTLAFLVPQSGCTPEWGDSGASVGAYNSQISTLKAAGGTVIPSFGGAPDGSTPNEIAQTCTSVSSLTAAYLNVVNTLGVNRLDFDIEGSVLDDSSANTRRNQALAALQAEDPSVQVDYTLAVDPTGLPSEELGVLQNAKSEGVKVSVVNLMTMDFGDGQNALADAESASTDTASQLASLYGVSASAGYALEGLTPIAGKNDDNENFTQANASTLESFAASKGVQELSFWELDEYDKATGYAYSRIFNQITSGSTGGGGGSSASGPITGYEGLCVDDRSASTADFNPVQVYTCNGTTAQDWTVASGNTLQVLGKCLDIDAAGTANGTAVDLYDCNGTGAQVWEPQSDGALLNPASGKCLDDTGFGAAGTQLQIWSCTGSANQVWKLPS
ncbi:ricin-type beta-trefoil lectin domain protein [Streptacidiphilus sp. P02-A3a]|uniref:ricin-type beta-trefoil lectin domain protein n=1 Tax=Streptacidiphilus sp. P02-A3a TaxID=2704468 RepID=UPI0015FE1CF4|nr:ricin-type beta-trefoil lectin domain protein [Streptacidiphilus sp. P02-A3a]QMU71661.1 hypothetical protein GXP74_28880 [Streptacidiphilus sp. P02-A3a]